MKDSEHTGQECHANSLYQDILLRNFQYGWWLLFHVTHLLEMSL